LEIRVDAGHWDEEKRLPSRGKRDGGRSEESKQQQLMDQGTEKNKQTKKQTIKENRRVVQGRGVCF